MDAIQVFDGQTEEKGRKEKTKTKEEEIVDRSGNPPMELIEFIFSFIFIFRLRIKAGRDMFKAFQLPSISDLYTTKCISTNLEDYFLIAFKHSFFFFF
jgi:hypothetical protein